MLGMPVILSKITFSQIIADNKIGGTSVILNCLVLLFYIYLQLNTPPWQVILGEKPENQHGKKTRESFVSSPLVYVALFFISFSSRFLRPRFALPCSWYRKWAI
jgi:uncharacterized membrane protein